MAELHETDNETTDSQSQGQPTSLGKALQAARATKALSLQDVSDSLRYSVKQIDALEKGDYHLLPDAMITRGFIRNYARLLEIDADPLLASYRESVASESDNLIAVKSTIRPVQLTKENQPWLKYILASILVLLFLLAWLFYVDNMPKSSNANVDKASDVAVDTVAVESLPEIALPAAQRLAENDSMAIDFVATPDVGLNDSTQASANVADVKPEEAVAQTDLKPLAPPVTLQTRALATTSLAKPADKAVTMVFTAQAWVSVTDKSGKVVYEKMSNNGDKETINVAPPLNLLIGNASATKLNVGGKDIDLAPNTKNNVARITLE